MIREILIVDDSPVGRKILRKCLPERPFEVREAADGADGLARFREDRPDCTFLDLTMPVMDGFEALVEMRKLDPTALIVICTADVQEKVLQRVADLGAFTTIKKPPSRDSVAQALQRAEEELAGREGAA